MIHYVDVSFLPLIFFLCLFFWFWPLKKILAPVTRYDDEEMTYLYGDSKFSLLGPTKSIDLHLDVVPLILQPVVYVTYPSSWCLVEVCIQGPETTFSYSFFLKDKLTFLTLKVFFIFLHHPGSLSRVKYEILHCPLLWNTTCNHRPKIRRMELPSIDGIVMW